MSDGITQKTAEILIEEWRMAAQDERGELEGREVFEMCADELEHNL